MLDSKRILQAATGFSTDQANQYEMISDVKIIENISASNPGLLITNDMPIALRAIRLLDPIEAGSLREISLTINSKFYIRPTPLSLLDTWLNFGDGLLLITKKSEGRFETTRQSPFSLACLCYIWRDAYAANPGNP